MLASRTACSQFVHCKMYLSAYQHFFESLTPVFASSWQKTNLGRWGWFQSARTWVIISSYRHCTILLSTQQWWQLHCTTWCHLLLWCFRVMLLLYVAVFTQHQCWLLQQDSQLCPSRFFCSLAAALAHWMQVFGTVCCVCVSAATATQQGSSPWSLTVA